MPRAWLSARSLPEMTSCSEREWYDGTGVASCCGLLPPSTWPTSWLRTWAGVITVVPPSWST